MQSLTDLAGETPPITGETQSKAAEGGEAGESQSLADLLNEEPAGKPEGESQSKTPESKRFLALAEKLSMKPEDLYGLEVEIPNGKPMTIGKLKDLAQKATDHEAAELELETKRQKQDAEYTRLRGELTELIRALPKAALSSETFTKARERYEARVKEAGEAALRTIPEWSDEAVMKADRSGMAEHLKQWGFDAGYLEQIADPRSLKFIRDSWRLSERVKAALSKVKKAGGSDRAPTGSNGKPPKKPASGKRAFDSPVQRQYAELLD